MSDGPGQLSSTGIVPRTILAAIGGLKLKLASAGGQSVRVFICMTDVADAEADDAAHIAQARLGRSHHRSPGL